MDQNTIRTLIVLLMPILVRLIRRWLPDEGRRALPLLAMGLGAAADTLIADGSPQVGAALGLAGVGWREALDQGWKWVQSPPR